MSENKGLQVSWATDLSPTALFSPWSAAGCTRLPVLGVGGGVPGVWGLVGGLEGYTGTPPTAIPGPIFSIF